MKAVLITGTGTGVGKTVVTAAVASCALAAGRTVAVVKPVQTGVRPDESGDIDDVLRLTGHHDLHEYQRFPDPLAPATAARRMGEHGPSIPSLVQRLHDLDDRDLVLIEGAGGALVRFNSARDTLLDLGCALQRSVSVEVLLVASSGLGVLNTAALTAAAVRGRGLRLAGTVVGAFPAEPDLAERFNLTDLPDYTGAPLLGVLPARAGATKAGEFAALARRSLAAPLHGSFELPTLPGNFQRATTDGTDWLPSTRTTMTRGSAP